MKLRTELKNTYSGERLSIGVSHETYEKLSNVALKEQRSLSAMARILIVEALNARETDEKSLGV